MLTFEQTIQIAGIVVSIISPIVVLGITNNYQKRNEKEKEERLAEKEAEKAKKENEAREIIEHQKLRELREADRDAKIEKLALEVSNVTQKVSTEIANISTKVDSIERDNVACHQDLKENLNTIQSAVQICMDYNRANGAVINAIGEGLRDNNIDGNVTHAISQYKAFETAIVSKMCKNMLKHEN